MTRKLFAAVALAAVVSAGCFDLAKSSVAPSGSGSLLAGNWVSATAGGLDTCTNFVWSVTEYTGSTGAGTFSATCLGIIQVAGTARGTLTSASLVNWTLSANASGPGLPASCPVALAGTATLTAQNITIPYSGTTCLGPISGTEILKKN